MNNNTFLISSLLLCVSVVIGVVISSKPIVIVSEKRIDKIPINFDGYRGKDVHMKGSIINELNADVYIYRNYIKGSNVINLYIGYYGTAKGGRTGHNPNACYPSSGYAILEERQVVVPVYPDEECKVFPSVTRMIISKGGVREIVYHWYQSSGDQVLANGMQQNIHRFKTLLLQNRNDGAFVRVSLQVAGNIHDAENELQSFARRIIPLISYYWPVEREIDNEK